MRGRRPSNLAARPARRPANPGGVHFLRDRTTARSLTRAARLGPGDLVVEFGAGLGALTKPLARTGAKVLAVERDPAFVAQLRKDFGECSDVRIVHADVRAVSLPAQPFTVVANLPFGLSTELLRRLMDERRSGFVAAELLVEYGFAKRVTASRPRDLELAWWAARFDLRIVRRVSRTAFSPAPAIDAAHLSIRRRSEFDRTTARALRTLLATVYARPGNPAAHAIKVLGTGKRTHKLLLSSGIDPPTPAGEVPIRKWRSVVSDL